MPRDLIQTQLELSSEFLQIPGTALLYVATSSNPVDVWAGVREPLEDAPGICKYAIIGERL